MRRCRSQEGDPESWDSGLIDWSDGTGDGPWRDRVAMATRLDDEVLDPEVAALMRRRPELFVPAGTGERCDVCGHHGAGSDGICEPCRDGERRRGRWGR